MTAALAPLQQRASSKGGRVSRKIAEPAPRHAFDLSGVHQRAGNRATGRWIQRLASGSPLIQRCACGGTCASCAKHDGEEDAAQRARSVGIQPRLAVNTVGDPYEIEADRVADQVMRMPDTAAPASGAAALSPTTAAHVSGSEAPAIVHRALQQSGRPLERETRSFMEARFGRDFGGVRIHDDGVSSASASAIGALAYTAGNHVVFRSGRYAPATPGGRRLLAHELAHVVQQGAAPGAGQRLAAVPTTVMRTAEECLRDCEQRFQQCLRGTRFPPECLSARGQCMSRCPPPTQEEESARRAARATRLRREGVDYGFLMAEAADSCRYHNGSPVADDWNFIPLERRPFIDHGGNPPGRWRVTAPPTPLLLDDSDAESFIEGVNRGLAAHAEIEAFFAPIAEALELLALAMNTSAAMRAGASISVAPRGSPTPTVTAPGAPLAPPVRFPPPRLVINRPGRTTSSPVQPGASLRAPARGGRGRGSQAVAEALPAETQPARPPERHLRVVPDPEPVPPPVAESVPQPPPRPVPQAGPQGSRAPGIFPPVVPLPSAVHHLRDARQRPPGCYPICWPLSFGIAPSMVFIRATTPDRDYVHARQVGLVLRWLREWRDPGFVANDYHVHHVLPLFLGGVDDLRSNGVVLPALVHLRGHATLQHQPQMATPPAPLRPLDPDIYRHPVGTMYWLAGYKANRESSCP